MLTAESIAVAGIVVVVAVAAWRIRAAYRAETADVTPVCEGGCGYVGHGACPECGVWVEDDDGA